LIAETSSLEIAMSKKQSYQKLMICNNNRGFTLIEIMIAMVIFVVGMLSVAAMQTGATKGNNTANRSTRAFTWCSDRMEVLMGLPYDDPNPDDLDPGEHSEDNGDFTQASDGIDNDYDGQIDEAGESGIVEIMWTVVDNDGIAGAPPPPENTKSIAVTVFWRTPMGKQKSLTLNTIRAQNATAS
jgi:prepilin-type N-terminal cleavage/methylation domain-containing protein